MKRTATILTLSVAALMFAAAGPASAQEEPTSQELKLDSQRAKINEVAEETLQKLFAENAKAKDLYDQALGWAVFDNTKVAFGISGGGGKGVAVSKKERQTRLHEDGDRRSRPRIGRQLLPGRLSVPG